MKKNLIILFLVLILNSCNSQEEVFIELKLKQTDTLKIEVSEFNKIYYNETLVVNDSSLKEYEILVLSVDENGYIIKWENRNKYNLEYSYKVPIDEVINNIINSLEYEILIDTCGDVATVNNWEQVKMRYIQLFNNVINNDHIPKELRSRYSERYEEMFNTKEKVIAAAKNHVEIIFSKFCQQYSLEEQKKETISMNIPSENNIEVFVEMISKVLSYKKDICLVDFNFEYDKKSLMKANIKNIQLSIQYKFDLDKGWLKNIKLNNKIIQNQYIISHREEYKFL